jgi:hypothetical protein
MTEQLSPFNRLRLMEAIGQRGIAGLSGREQELMGLGGDVPQLPNEFSVQAPSPVTPFNRLPDPLEESERQESIFNRTVDDMEKEIKKADRTKKELKAIKALKDLQEGDKASTI